MEEKGKNSDSETEGTNGRVDKQPSGLTRQSENEENPENGREVTDILLGQISLFIASDAEVKTGYRYNFMNSRTTLFLGSDREKCGRHGIVLDHQCVSPVHATIHWQEGSFILQDEGSKQGTFLEGEKLVANTSAKLPAKSSFRLGSLVLEYRIEFPGFKEARESTAKESPKNAKNDIVLAKQSVVVAEFCLLSMDAPYALPRHCEILSKKPVFTLGRSEDCDYQVEFKERYVSENQAAIIYSAQERVFLIKELDKENPTLVNDNRIKEVHRLSSGDVLRLGVAANAPRVRFTLAGQEDANKEVRYLAQVLPALERKKTYLLGNGKTCDIEISDPTVCGVVAKIEVPERGEGLLVRKLEGKNRISIDDSEVKEGEMRVLSPQQTLQVDSFALIHDHGNFITPRIPEKSVLSQFISTPQRDEVYLIGSAMHCTVRIPELNVPQLIGEISVPIEGEYFLVKKYSGVDLDLDVDGESVPEGSVNEVHYGVNQVLTIHDYLTILNNHRSLPAYAKTGMWKKFLKSVIIFAILIALGTGVGILIKKHWSELKQYGKKLTLDSKNGNAAKQEDETQSTVQLLMKKYQKNVFYVLLFRKDQNEKKMASGTAFLVTQTDAKDEDSYYLITCKHVIEPWLFEKREKDGEFFDEQGQKIDTDCYIAVWPYGEKVLEEKDGKWSYLLKNSFSNAPVECLGQVKVYRKGNDDYEALENGFQRHRRSSNEDIAILELKANTPSIEQSMLKSRYQQWSLYDENKLDVGLPVIVLGYARGGDRLTQKGGLAQPANCKGSLASTCKQPEFLEIDANQTQGASGGPIIDLRGKIVGMVSFSDSDKRMIYGIHSLVLRRLLLSK